MRPLRRWFVTATQWPGRLAVLTAVAITLACTAPATYLVDRADVTIQVRSDGAIVVREVWTVRFNKAGQSLFRRRIPLERADALAFESAALDGTSMKPGRHGETELEVDADGDLDVVWTFPSSGRLTHVIELAYRATGAVAVRGNRGIVRQTAVPAGRTFSIERANVRLAVDPGMHHFDGAGIAEAGWVVVRTGDGIAAERTGLAPPDGAIVLAEVAIDPAVIAEPSWQRYEDWTRDLIPAFVSGGLFILVIGAGVLWIIRFQYPRARAGSDPRSSAETRERDAVRAGLRTSGYVAVVLSAALAVVTWLTLRHFGWWPMSLPLSIFIVGVVFLGVRKTIV